MFVSSKIHLLSFPTKKYNWKRNWENLNKMKSWGNIKKLIRNAWQHKWISCLPSNDSWHRSIYLPIYFWPSFWDFDLFRFQIVTFTRLRLGNDILLNYSYHISINSSPLCTLHTTKVLCDLHHILFDYPSPLYPPSRINIKIFTRLHSLSDTFQLPFIINYLKYVLIDLELRLNILM